MTQPTIRTALCTVSFLSLGAVTQAAKLVDVRPVDEEHIMLTWQDAWVHYREDPTGPRAYSNPEGLGGDRVEKFGEPLDTKAATEAAGYALSSTDDSQYMVPAAPLNAFRKSKVTGSAWGWPDPECTLEHTIFLRLPKKMQQGKRYRLSLPAASKTDRTEIEIVFDVTKNVSEAIHVNLIGYHPQHTEIKAADLYMWLGDGGARDYSSHVGRRVSLLNVSTGRMQSVGKVAFWKKSSPDFGKWNLTASDVWTCDFSAFRGTGTYRLVVDGVGCSPEFKLSKDVYFEPYQKSVQGFYYMRIGEPKLLNPVPRQPRYVPNVDPPNFKVYRTTFGPGHPEWGKAGGDPWDVRDWSMYKEPGEPTNPDAWGGHSDAADWDRHPGHISIIWDMLLPYILSNGKLNEDNLGIRESGNGIPDLIDEARDEVDFWLRLRDGNGGYSFGLGNPSQDDTVMYQAVAHPYMAWASAMNSAMLADAFRIAKKRDLMVKYRDAAIEAWNKAAGQGLDFKYSIGNGATTGRDLKMMAAAYLYNVTGDRKWEDEMVKENRVVPGATTEVTGEYNQLWGVAAYLMAAKNKWRPIHHPQVAKNFRDAVIAEARSKNVFNTRAWPSRRSSDPAYGWFQTTQEVQRVCVAHAVAPDAATRSEMLRALILEADWGLGRNPMNMVQMTKLGSRYVDDIYTSGRNDGSPGVHPGHTPYMNAEPWGTGFMADPKYYARLGYPAWEQWPYGEAFWRARYCYSNNEFTPQQSMRGKMALLGYLYTLR